MTTTQDLIDRLRKRAITTLTLSQAADALEALQAENARLTKECDSFEVANIAVAFERDKALARLAEIESTHIDEVMNGLMLEKSLANLKAQEPVEIRYRNHYPSGPADGTRRIGDWQHIDYCTRNYGHNPLALENADAVEHLYAAAGASPVEPSQAQPPAPGEAAREYMTGYSVRRRSAA